MLKKFMLIFLAIFLVSCGGSGQYIVNKFTFSGKTVNTETNEWLNNRLVLLYLKGEEVGRATTAIGESSLSGEGVTDGFFQIAVPNTYAIPITVVDGIINQPDYTENFDFGGIQEKSNATGGRFYGLEESFINIWLGELQEGKLYRFPVPSKNIEYAIKIFATDVQYLPPEILVPNSTRLTDSDEIVLVINADTTTGQSDTQIRAIVQEVKYNTGQDVVQLNKITVPINNCGGSSPVSQEYSYEQTFYHEYKSEYTAGVESGIPLPAGWPEIVVELQAKYGFEQGQIASQKAVYHMEAQPKTKVVYVVNWQEVWDTGVATALAGNDLIEVPFRIRTNVIYEITSEEFSCK
jgi:hypothetical protein